MTKLVLFLLVKLLMSFVSIHGAHYGMKLGDFRRRLLQVESQPNQTESTFTSTSTSTTTSFKSTNTYSTTYHGLYEICFEDCDVFCDSSCNEDCDSTKCDSNCDENCDDNCDSCCDYESCADGSDAGTSYSDTGCRYEDCWCECDESCNQGCDESCKEVGCDSGCDDDCDTGCDADCKDTNISLITGGWVSYYDEQIGQTVVDWDFTYRKDSGHRIGIDWLTLIMVNGLGVGIIGLILNEIVW